MYVDEIMCVLICDNGTVHSFDGFYGVRRAKEAEEYAKLYADKASCGPHKVGEVHIHNIRKIKK
jgi:hypothetical protein